MPIDTKNIMWLSTSSYIRYKNTCLAKECKTRDNNSSTEKNTSECVWTNYSDYLKYKNVQRFAKDSTNLLLA